MPNLPKGIKIYRKFRYRKGHGIHSPFVYNIVTKVIEEKSPYYVFDEIDYIRKKILALPNQHGHSMVMQHRSCGQLLFRLVNFFQCKNVLQIGSPEGFIALYLASAHSGSECLVLEENKEWGKFTENVIIQAGLKNVRVEVGNYLSKINELFENTHNFDCIFMSVPDEKLCKQIVKMCHASTNNEVVIVINGINKNKTMRLLWQELIKDDEIKITIDLYTLGIVILKKNIHKQHYKAYFDNGKKQNLHKNGRQRFYFFGRRNKDSQNTYSLGRLWNG